MSRLKKSRIQSRMGGVGRLVLAGAAFGVCDEDEGRASQGETKRACACA